MNPDDIIWPLLAALILLIFCTFIIWLEQD
jgi:hypothetical protein